MSKRIVSIVILSYITFTITGCSCSRPNPPPERTPGLYLEQAKVNEGNDGIQKLEFKVVLTPIREEAVTVDYQMLNSTLNNSADENPATVNIDYIPLSKGTVTIAPGESQAKISIDVKGDSLYERDEIVAVQILNAHGADIIESSAIGRIINDDPAPVASIALENASDSTTLSETGDVRKLKLSLDVVSGLDASVQVNWSGGETDLSSGSARVNIDFIADNSSFERRTNPVTIPAGEVEKTFSITTVDDGDVEGQEGFTLDLAKLSTVRDVTISTTNNKISFVINDNDVSKVGFTKYLNDTGIQDAVTTTYAAHEDGKIGRDADAKLGTLTKVGSGLAGFDFTKLDSNGQALSQADQSLAYSAKHWSCVKDNRTGLIWETKNNIESESDSLHSSSRTMSWYDPIDDTNGGNKGDEGEAVDCIASDNLHYCSTAYYVARVNAAKLCGKTGWRMPTIEELRGIASYAIDSTNVYKYDVAYFNGDKLNFYVWSSNTVTGSAEEAWAMDFKSGKYPQAIAYRKSAKNIAIPMLVNDADITQ